MLRSSRPDRPQRGAFLGKTGKESIYRLFAAGHLPQSFATDLGTRELRAMLQDPANRDVFTVHRPSPWPYVGAMVAASALITTLVAAFSG
jgi:hypothetical protein